MAQESVSETPDVSSSSSSSSSQVDPSFTKSGSFSRLNAQAPEFVPTRPNPRTDLQQQPRLVGPPPPPPPPQGMVHVYPPPPLPPTSAFHMPIRPHVPVVSVQNHHHHHHHLPHQHHMPAHYHPHQHQYYVSSGGAGLGDQEQKIQKPQVEPDHAPFKNKLPEEASQKILNQVT